MHTRMGLIGYGDQAKIEKSLGDIDQNYFDNSNYPKYTENTSLLGFEK